MFILQERTCPDALRVKIISFEEAAERTLVELGDESFRLKKSFEAADKMGSRYLLIVGGDEVAADAFALKHLASGEQVTVPRAELAQRILRK